MSWRQFELRSMGNEYLLCWLEDDPRLVPGRGLTLKGDVREWRVITRYNRTLDAPPEKRWQVGGLQ